MRCITRSLRNSHADLDDTDRASCALMQAEPGAGGRAGRAGGRHPRHLLASARPDAAGGRHPRHSAAVIDWRRLGYEVEVACASRSTRPSRAPSTSSSRRPARCPRSRDPDLPRPGRRAAERDRPRHGPLPGDLPQPHPDPAAHRRDRGADAGRRTQEHASLPL